MGGDGTILTALRMYAGTGVPVFAVNFGEIGFLATVECDDAQAGFERAFAGDFDVLPLPGIEFSGCAGRWLAINDVSMHRQPGKRVADLQVSVGSDEIGRVRCDGLAVATPAGSTGYNLANGGPVMAWGVGGVRGVLHRAALAHRACPGGRSDRHADRLQLLSRGAGRRRGGRPTGMRALARGADRGPLRAGAGPSGAAAGGDVLPPPAGEVRAIGQRALRTRRSVGRAWYTPSVLEELRVENLLLVEKAELRLAPGLNVITGETGAGKTMLAHALDLLLGGRPRSGIVRTGASEAYVEGVFTGSIGDEHPLAERVPDDAEEW